MWSLPYVWFQTEIILDNVCTDISVHSLKMSAIFSNLPVQAEFMWKQWIYVAMSQIMPYPLYVGM